MDLLVDFDLTGLENAFLTEFADYLNKSIGNAVNIVRAKIPVFVNDRIKNSQEYFDITSGFAFGEIGQPGISKVVEGVINAIIAAIQVKIEPCVVRNNQIEGAIEIGILRKDFAEVLAVNGVQFTSVNSRGISTEVPWMKWLLFEGTAKVVSNFKFSLDERNIKYSRTGTGIMFNNREGWNVPPTIAGIAENNWLTRCLKGIDELVVEELVKEIK